MDADPFVVADTHFYHARLHQEFEPIRQTLAANPSDFDARLLDILSGCSPLLHLGDLAIDSRDSGVGIERVASVSRKIDGPKILIQGNHDSVPAEVYRKNGWIFVDCGIDLVHRRVLRGEPPFLFFQAGDRRILASHYPAKRPEGSWRHSRECVRMAEIFEEYDADINLHGTRIPGRFPSLLFGTSPSRSWDLCRSVCPNWSQIERFEFMTTLAQRIAFCYAVSRADSNL